MMLRKEQNDLLCRTGPGTPAGQLFRLSWQPALLAEELPENECSPVRVKLLGERLLAWRDTQDADCEILSGNKLLARPVVSSLGPVTGIPGRKTSCRKKMTITSAVATPSNA